MIGHFVRFGPSSHQHILGILSLHYAEIKEGGGGDGYTSMLTFLLDC